MQVGSHLKRLSQPVALFSRCWAPRVGRM